MNVSLLQPSNSVVYFGYRREQQGKLASQEHNEVDCRGKKNGLLDTSMSSANEIRRPDNVLFLHTLHDRLGYSQGASHAECCRLSASTSGLIFRPRL